MAAGEYPRTLDLAGTLARELYGSERIHERHRHRYEFNNAYIDQFRNAGMLPVGLNPQTNLVEIVELQDHPWFIGVQYHPEYKSTVAKPHPLFIAFVKAAIDAASVPGASAVAKAEA